MKNANKHSTSKEEGYNDEEKTSDKENKHCIQLSQKRSIITEKKKINKCSDETRPFVLLQNQAHIKPDSIK